jgi:glycosyltransferase involved in cell wall biosynthesis
MKVVLTIAGLSPEFGGPSQSIPALAEALARENVDVDLLTCEAQPGYNPPALANTNLVRATLLPVRSRRGRWRARGNDFFFALCERARDNDTVIHDNGVWLPSNHAVAAAARLLKRPMLISPRGMLSQWALSHRRWKKSVAWRWFQRKDLFSASALHVTSEQELADVRRAGFRGPIAVIPNGINLPGPTGPWTTDHGPQDSRIRTALFVGRVHQVKGLMNLVEAWSVVRPSGWRMVIAGSDEDGYAETLKAEIKKLKVEHDFEFVGPVEGEKKNELYRNADLFILPSYSENFGLAIAEALANELPVITTKGTPWKDLVDHDCGWWEEIGVEQLARALRKATELDDEARRRMGNRGGELVAMKYSWPELAKKMKSLYEWLLGRGPQPECLSAGTTGRDH